MALDHWELDGKDRSRFRAYSTLLHLQTNGQVHDPYRGIADDNVHEKETGDKTDIDDETDGDDDVGSTDLDLLTCFDDGSLKDMFLDRIAEVASRAKGGRYVAAAIMREGEKAVEVSITRNEGFDDKDQEFFKALEVTLRHISLDNNPSHVQQLCQSSFDYQVERVQTWLGSFLQIYRQCQVGTSGYEFELQGEPDQSHLAHELAIALFVIHRLVTSCDSILLATTPMEIILASQICRTVWKCYTVGIFEVLGTKFARLRDCVGFLGRLSASCDTIARACRRLPGFAAIALNLVSKGPRIKSRQMNGPQIRPPKPWTLHNTLQYLSNDGCDATINARQFRGHDASTKFKRLMSEKPQVHAEIQLLLSLAGQSKITHDYIGCSKRLCYLCATFIRHYSPEYRTRGTHGALFPSWTIPALIAGTDRAMAYNIALALRAVERDITRLVALDRKRIPAAKQSSVGGSSVQTVVPARDHDSLWIRELATIRICEERNYNSATVMLNDERNIHNSDEYCEITDPAVQIPDTIAPSSGKCEGPMCDRITNLRCSFCQRGSFCGPRCQKTATMDHRLMCRAGPITPFDYISISIDENRDPEDPDVLETFGFDQCEGVEEMRYLLGLYIGLYKIIETPKSDIDSWVANGTLRENIIKTYERHTPPGRQGAYYPWFKQSKILSAEAPRRLSLGELLIQRTEECKQFLSQEDQAVPLLQLCEMKHESVTLWAFCSLSMTPHANFTHIWFDFGFCVCRGDVDERDLGALYCSFIYGNVRFERDVSTAMLMPTPQCDFDEFRVLFLAGNLISLMDRHGFRGWSRQIPHLREFLSIAPHKTRPLVWHLKHLLALGDSSVDAVLLAGVHADHIEVARHEFGLVPGGALDLKEVMCLKAFYRRLLFSRSDYATLIDPLELERSRTEGRMLGFLQQAIETLSSQGDAWLRGQSLDVGGIIQKAFGI
ncbi:hypothetical protein F4808DRAFT_436920 [Astrocystis sublimbata]|nr:hypothetical protein F4808DRAFT_436920 [Astrocystis sublimbata]